MRCPLLRVKGGRDASIKFMDSLELATIATHVADCKTLLLHPASHTHRQLSDEQLREAGIAPDLIRFSVGLEDADDIIADIEQALAKSDFRDKRQEINNPISSMCGNGVFFQMLSRYRLTVSGEGPPISERPSTQVLSDIAS